MSRCTEDLDGLYYIVLIEFEDELALEFLKERAPQASIFVSPFINMAFEHANIDRSCPPYIIHRGTTAQRDGLNDGAAQRTAVQRDGAVRREGATVRCKRQHNGTTQQDPLRAVVCIDPLHIMSHAQ